MMTGGAEIVIRALDDAVLAKPAGARMGRSEEADALQVKLAALAAQGGGLPVILDMSDLEWIASLYVGALVAVRREFGKRNRRFILAGLSPQVRETLATCRLDKIFEIFDSADAALAELRRADKPAL